MEFFKRYILEVRRDPDGEPMIVKLLGLEIDFRYWYKSGIGLLYLSTDVQGILKDVETRNKRRKNKLPLPVFVQVPWYKSIFHLNGSAKLYQAVLHFVLLYSIVCVLVNYLMFG